MLRKIVTNQKVVADELGDYFSTAANAIGGAQVMHLVEKDFEKHPSVESIRQAYQGLQFGFNEIGSGEVENELKILKSNKATGWDGISPKILKLTAKGLAPSLTSLYNSIIRKGNWPNTWKMGEWTPVFKKGDKTDPGNYRPITVLNSVDKVFESLLSKQIMETMNPHLYQKMSAYRKTHSCETTLIRLTEDWKMAADNKEYVTVLSTDMSKAFDSLHPALMIQKLKAYGFSERALNLLRSFLERRRNRVKLQEAHSAWKEQKRGCPQGSSFGPLLWNLFQNDLSLHRQSASLFMYADDHQIYANDNDIQKAAQTLRRETEAVSQWYKENLLQANPQKYQILTLDPQPSKRTPEYALKMEFDGHEVKSSEYLKILGVTIDNKLTFSEHISDICKKTSYFPVRLNGSSVPFAGTIEVMYQGVWGGVLGVDINVGHVVCRQLGYSGADEIFNTAFFGQVKGPLWIWRIRCSGYEARISDCAVTTWDKATDQDMGKKPFYVSGVLCNEGNDTASKDLKVRLAGAPISNAGRVEVFYAGVWGTVSGFYFEWDMNAAHVVCRQLGYPGAVSFGPGYQLYDRVGRMWFENVRCLGNESNFGECSKDVAGYRNFPYVNIVTATVLCKLPYQSDCSQVTCANSGACVENAVGAICNCTDGFTGLHCEIPTLNPCQSSPCENGGKCFSNGSSYLCAYPKGRCEEPILTAKPTTSEDIFKTPFTVLLSVSAAVVVLLIAAVVYLIFRIRRLLRPQPNNTETALSNYTYNADTVNLVEEEANQSNDVDARTGTA
ncbi:hypothetical protein ACROYT_G006578 [Oculina patagonica]